jgi:hypothetical protein
LQKGLGLTSTGLFDPILIGSGRSDLDHTAARGWGGSTRALVWRGGGGLAGESCKRDSGHDSGSGLAWEEQSGKGKAARGSGRRAKARKGRSTVARGMATLVRNRAREKVGKGGEKGRRRCSPPRKASTAGKGDGVARR